MPVETTDPVAVAGHIFDKLTDRCIVTKSTGGVCGMHRIYDVHPATRADIGKPGYCCVASLNEVEYNQIDADRRRVQANRDRAYNEVAASAKGI
jgi:hypothetical protein